MHNVEKMSISINEYVLNIKGVIESVGSKNVCGEDDDLVSVYLNGLIKDYMQFKISMA